jgi:TolB protein
MYCRHGIRIATIAATIAMITPSVGSAQPASTAAVSAGEPSLWAAGAIMPALSRKGDQLAVSYQGAIWRMLGNDGTLRRLTSGEGFDIYPAWSPDGTRIAYLNSRDFGPGRLRVIRANDGAAEKIPESPPVRGQPFFDREGLRILAAFMSDDGKSHRLAWFDLATGTIGEPVYPLEMRRKFALSHDRRTIVATATRDVPEEQSGNFGPRTVLWRIPAEGGEPERLGEWPARIHELSFTPDDQALIVATDLGGAHHDLWQVPLTDVERGGRRLTFGAVDESEPTVSAFGRKLVYTDNSLGSTGLVMLDLADGRTSRIETRNPDYRKPVGQLALNLIDDATGAPLTARCSLQDETGKYHAPPGALYRVRGEMHWYVEGSTEFTLPAGRYRLRVARGPEYRAVRMSFEVPEKAASTQTVRLKRWTDQAARGWYSGDSHVHANYGYGHWYNSPQTVRAQCAGEDLVVSNLMVANSDGDGVFDREYFRGAPDPLSTPRTVLYWNEEYRSTLWGHMTLLNLKQLVDPIFTGFEHTTHPHDHPTNADAGLATHDQQGHVNYTHPASNIKDPFDSPYAAKGLPIDVALGTVDSIDVMGSSHVANLPLWYRLLNCGFRIPASAGTDCFLNRISSIVPGGDRVYVKVDGEFSYQRWIEGLKAGRTFVTNGPMLDVTIDGKLPGEVLQFDGPIEVKVTAEVRAELPLDRIEWVQNGVVVATEDVRKAGTEIRFERSVPIKTGGWLAVRVTGPAHPASTRGEAFAHSSPVYVEVKGAPIDAKADAQYFVVWIDRLWESVRRRNRIPPRLQPDVEAQVGQARDVYLKLIDKPSGNLPKE